MMPFTRGIEQRLEHIQDDLAHSYIPDQGLVNLSAADVQWLILLARNATHQTPTLEKKHIKLTRVAVILFFSALGLLSTAGIIWAVKLIIRLLS